MAKKKASTDSSSKKKQTELVSIELPLDLVRGMDIVGISNREEYIKYLIASSLLNYQKIWKDAAIEKDIQKIKNSSDRENHLR